MGFKGMKRRKREKEMDFEKIEIEKTKKRR
jgi:hypothetical protein